MHARKSTPAESGSAFSVHGSRSGSGSQLAPSDPAPTREASSRDTRSASDPVTVPGLVARVVVPARIRRGVGGPLLLALRHGGRGLRPAGRPHRMSRSRSRSVEWRVHCGLPSDVVGRSGSKKECQKRKGPSPFLEVMALCLSSLLRSAWLHHPVHVGRLMPTLVRRRPSSRPRNMVSTYYAIKSKRGLGT